MNTPIDTTGLAAEALPARRLGRPQRGMVTVEFIFGTLVVIAIVTVVATMLHDAKMASFFADVFTKLVKMIFA